jgi:hypothetical protein
LPYSSKTESNALFVWEMTPALSSSHITATKPPHPQEMLLGVLNEARQELGAKPT